MGGARAATWRHLAAVVHAAFAHRRKTLVNSVSLAGLAPRDRVERALAELELPAAVRAEALPPEAFPPLARRLAGDAA